MFFLHGFMGSIEDFDCLPKNFFGLDYVNALGIDVSKKPWDEISNYLWEQVSDEKISLFGYSMGGRIALAMFAAQPDRVEKLVLCGAQFRPPVEQKNILPLPQRERGQEGARIPEHLLKYARELRVGQTDAEKLIWHFLRKKNLADSKFRRQHPIGNYIVDFYCHEKKLVIELDGSQHFKEKEKLYDKKRTQFLNEQGIKVLRFDNVRVLTQPIPVLESIFRALKLPLPLGEGWGGGDQAKQVDQKDKKIGKDTKIKDGPEKLESPTLTPQEYLKRVNTLSSGALPLGERGQEGARISREIVDEERAIFLRDQPDDFLDWWSTLELFGPQKSMAWSLVKERRATRMKTLAPVWANLLGSLSVSAQPDFSTLIKEHAQKIIFIYGANDEKYAGFAKAYRKLGVQTIAVPDAWHAVHLDEPDYLASILNRIS